MPHEIAVGGIYLSPLLVAAGIGVLAAIATAWVLNRRRWSRFVGNPPLVFVSLVVIYTIVVGELFIGV